MIFLKIGAMIFESSRSENGVVVAPCPHFGAALCTPCLFTSPVDASTWVGRL